MEYTADELEDLEMMRVMRGRIRAVAERKIAECEHLPRATSVADMARQMRTLAAADRMIVALYSPPPRRRRRTKPQPSAAPPPPPFRVSGGEVPTQPTEGSATAPALPPQPESVSASDAAMDLMRGQMQRTATDSVNEMTHRCAQWAHIWPDGAPYDASEADWQKHTLAHEIQVPADGGDEDVQWLHREILKGCNAIARQSGRKFGIHFDTTPYNDSDPDYYTLSANTFTGGRRADNEEPGPPGLPWWIVRRPSA